jgi:hypothetical protein
MTNKEKALGMGLGLAALAAVTAYFFYGKRGAKNRALLADWALQLQDEVAEKAGQMKDLNQKTYNDLVDRTALRYGRVKRVGASELLHLAEELKSSWARVEEQLN